MAEPIAASLFSVRANLITSQLLEESRKQAEELASQEQELRKINNELTLQSDKLRVSEDELKTQQLVLKNMNIQLREKARLLEEQNLALEETRLSLSFKASQLEESNKYKSAVLANMSHELRTPLNSILILARLLADNKGEHLSQREIEHAQVIHKSGTDLLNLINDILDLSKIEAGKVELIKEIFSLNHFSKEMHLLFREVAADRNINFECQNPSEEITLNTDQVRLSQVIKNLLSNAFKFTPEGGKVTMTYDYALNETIFNTKELLQAEKVVCIQIKETGIGIPEEDFPRIFERGFRARWVHRGSGFQAEDVGNDLGHGVVEVFGHLLLDFGGEVNGTCQGGSFEQVDAMGLGLFADQGGHVV
jgi:signal transduction histidine kinase